MTADEREWWERWKAARKAHYSSAKKLWEALRAQGYEKLGEGTVLNWERRPAARQHHPSPKYRGALAALNDDFAALIAELDASTGPSPTRVEMRLDRIEGEIAKISKAVREIRELVKK